MRKLKDLAKDHADHTVSYDATREPNADLDRALDIYISIGNRIGKIGDLYRSAEGSENAFSDDNAIMGILAKLLGFDDDARKIYDGLDDMKTNNLVSTIKGSNVCRTDANAYYSIFCRMTGKKKEAKATKRKITEDIGKLPNGLYAGHVVEYWDNARHSGGTGKTIHNAAMATLEAALGSNEADILYEKIGDVIGRDGKLYLSDLDSFEKCEDNIAMAVVCELLGKDEEASDIYNSLDELYGTGYLLKAYIGNSGPSTKESALSGLYHCIRGGKRLGKWQNG